MDRGRADRVVAGVLLVGAYSTLRAYVRVQTTEGMMGRMMGSLPGADPFWYAVGTLVAASVVVGAYAAVRPQLPGPGGQDLATHPAVDSRPQADTIAREDDEVARLLEVLPEDERRVIEPVLESPGVTQVELRARAGFSKAKISQVVTSLQDRGLLYREPQGRTYRVYPTDRLTRRNSP